MNVKPLHVFLIITIALGLVGLAAYSGAQGRQILGPSDLRMDHDGNLHVRIDETIFVYNESIELVDTYSLEKFGIGSLLGSFDFFSDNSILLVADTVTDHSAMKAGRLLRCSVSPPTCAPLDASDLRFGSSFRTHVDNSDQVFLAHTTNDTVYWQDQQGQELSQLKGGLNRPNHLWRYEDKLAIANTDGFELLVVPLSGRTFASRDQWQVISMDSEPNRSRGERRPIDFLQIDSSWYVLAKTSDMRSGAIYRFDTHGNFQSHFALSPGADPMAIAYMGGSIVVADYAGMKIDRYTLKGEQLPALDSVAQREHIENLQHRRLKFALLEYSAWGVFAIAMLAGFIVAIRGEMRKARSKSEKRLEERDVAAVKPTARPHPMEAAIHWLQPKKTPLWIGALSLLAMLAMPLIMDLALPETEEPERLCIRYSMNIVVWVFTGAMVLILVPLVIKLRTTVSTRIGFRDEWVLVDHGNGSMYIAQDKDLVSVNNGFMIDGVTIPTGNHQISLYDSAELEKWLEPRLAVGSKLGLIQQTRWQWHNRRGLFLLSLLGIILGGALIIVIEMGWLENRFEEWLQTRPECQMQMEEADADTTQAPQA